MIALITLHNAGAWAAAAAWATFVVLLLTLAYVARQVRDQFRPWVTVSFHFRSIIAFIVVRNLGNTPARDLRIRFDFGLLDGARLPDKGMHDLVEAVKVISDRLEQLGE